MQEFKEFQGKSLDEAIRMACNYFDAPREKLEIDLVQDAKNGIFGLVGMRNAMIRARRSQLQSTINNLLDDGKGAKKPKPALKHPEKYVENTLEKHPEKQLDRPEKPLGEPKLAANPSRRPKKVPRDLELDDSIGNRIDDPLLLDDELLDGIGNCEPKLMRGGQNNVRDSQFSRGQGSHEGQGARPKFVATERLDRTHWDHPKPVPTKKSGDIPRPDASRPDVSRPDARTDAGRMSSRHGGSRTESSRDRVDHRLEHRTDRQDQSRVATQARPDQARQEQPRVAQARSDQPRAAQPRLDQPRVAQPRLDQPRSEQARPERSDLGRAEAMPKPEHIRSDAEAVAAAAEALAAFKALDKEKLLAEAKNIAQGIMTCILGEVPIEVSLQDDRVLIQVDCGEDSGLLIGREGMTLASLQYISSRMLSRSMDASVRVQFDIGDYRERQDDRLYDLAFVLAARVRQTSRPASTKPLSSYHRRVIHMALQNEPDLFTRSFGDGALKRVIIQKKR